MRRLHSRTGADLTMMREYEIVYLADARDSIPALADLFVEEWAPYYGPGGPGDATADLEECCNIDSVPLALVAMSGEGTVLGTAALKSGSVGDDLCDGPWLAALVVVPGHRGAGCGSALIAAIERRAKHLGYPGLACSTDAGEKILRRRGWTHIGHSDSLRGSVPVYRLEFGVN